MHQPKNLMPSRPPNQGIAPPNCGNSGLWQSKNKKLTLPSGIVDLYIVFDPEPAMPVGMSAVTTSGRSHYWIQSGSGTVAPFPFPTSTGGGGSINITITKDYLPYYPREYKIFNGCERKHLKPSYNDNYMYSD